MSIKRTLPVVAISVAMLISALPAASQTEGATPAAAEQLFSKQCANCHGEGARGGERGPSLVMNPSLRNRSEKQLHDVIRKGTDKGMPPFALPEVQLDLLARWVRSLNAPAFDFPPQGDAAKGEQFFFAKGQCGTCHMVAGRGKSMGPDLSEIGKQFTIRDLEQALDKPGTKASTTSSCPSFAWCPQNQWKVVTVNLRDGSTLRGFARSQGKHDLQLQTLNGQFRFLLDSEYEKVVQEKVSLMPALQSTAEERRNLLAYLGRLGGIAPGPLANNSDAVPTDAIEQILHPTPGEWPGYNGAPEGNRHSSLDQINAKNVDQLQLQWSYTLPHPALETTPLMSNGVMYVTGPNRVCALDPRTGREIWCFARPRSKGQAGANESRGAAILGDRIFYTTDDAHLLCLSRLTGAVMWEVVMPDSPGPFGASAAPLVVGDLVIAGIAGGDGPLRGFLAAYRATTGQQAWRFFTVPKRGEPGSETWSGKVIEVGGGATWLTGSYDPQNGLLYWPTGQPYPATDGVDRIGDNLYTDSVVALEVKTGKLRWHFQFTPHDLHDWDATEPLVLVDAPFRGRDRKLLMQANRNGFFYVLDRNTGEFLLGKPFVNRITWASGIGADGRPQLLEGNKPSANGTKTCPAVRGATNWYSTAFNPATNLFYVMAVEDCTIYQTGRRQYVPYREPTDPPMKFLRAIDVESGKIAWEIEQVGPPEYNYSGVLSTAGGTVFYGETGGGFAAVDAKTGKTLWHFESNQVLKGSPMTYMLNGRQYVAVAAGSQILSFALPGK